MMAFVITAPCMGVKDKSCVAVCPMDCIHEGTVEREGVVYDQMFINPDDCIDCGLCEPECPVDAIFLGDEVPQQWVEFSEINADFYKNSEPIPAR